LALAALSLLSSAAGYVFYAAFLHGSALEAARRLVPCLAAAGIALSAGLFLRAFGRGFMALGALVHFVNPLRALLVAAAWLVVLLVFPLLGLLRQCALLGALLAGLAVLTPRVVASFALAGGSSSIGHPLVAFAPFSALLALLAAGALVPLSDIRQHAGEVVCSLDGPRGHHVVTKVQGGLVLFSNQVVATTSVDATRFAEALVHPALAIAELRGSVLVLDDAAGAVEREILRWPGVGRVTLLPSDPALWRLARASSAFRALGADALDSGRLRVVTEEPAPFVLRGRERYSVILANLSDPIGYLEGKYYTVRFFEALRERLAPGGVFALQITSPERTPRTHASILATLRHAGFTSLPYRAPLPTLGEWGFALAIATTPGTDADSAERALSARVRAVRSIPAGTSLVTPRTLWSLFEPPGSQRPSEEPPNFSYHQALLELYQDEERRFSE
jgi:spermidine synthase